MLDFSEFHGMARNILVLFLKEAAKAKNVHSRKIVELIQDICKKDEGLSVKTEEPIPILRVRPDLVVWGDPFLLAVEIKRRLGVETFVHGKWQNQPA